MMAKPIFCATHPRACSTAFERVFMTRKDLTCIHEPFGDAFYYGPERMSARYENDEAAREESGFSHSTYQTIFDRFDRESSEGKPLFIKDIIYYLVPPDQQPAKIAPSLHPKKRGIGTVSGVNGVNGAGHKAPFPYTTEAEPGNPTVVPQAMLEKFHFTFLIRNPHRSIPSYFRCTIPPLDDMTGFYEFYPNEAGYDELRRFFDYTRAAGMVGSNIAGQTTVTNGTTSNGDSANGDLSNGHLSNGHNVNGASSKVDIALIDADDLLDDPEGILRVYCDSIGLAFSADMLNWDNEYDQNKAKEAFEKWKGFHEDAIDSKDLKPRTHKKSEKSEEEWDTEWKAKYGEQGAKVIRETVDANMADYLYLKQFALKA